MTANLPKQVEEIWDCRPETTVRKACPRKKYGAPLRRRRITSAGRQPPNKHERSRRSSTARVTTSLASFSSPPLHHWRDLKHLQILQVRTTHTSPSIQFAAMSSVPTRQNHSGAPACFICTATERERLCCTPSPKKPFVQPLSSSWPNAAMLVRRMTATTPKKQTFLADFAKPSQLMANYRQSLNDAGADARPSPLCQFVIGLVFSVATSVVYYLHAFPRPTHQTIASCLPGAPTSAICPFFGTKILVLSAESSPAVFRHLSISCLLPSGCARSVLFLSWQSPLCFSLAACKSNSPESPCTFFARTWNSFDISFGLFFVRFKQPMVSSPSSERKTRKCSCEEKLAPRRVVDAWATQLMVLAFFFNPGKGRCYLQFLLHLRSLRATTNQQSIKPTH